MEKLYTKGYILALSIIALASIIGQVLVQRSISSQSNDAHIINLAGRQRMLSQRISLFASSKIASNKELKDLISEWSTSHKRLYNNDFNSAILKDPKIKEQLALTLSQSEKLIDEITKASPDNFIVLNKSTDFLKNMDVIVFRLEQLSTAKVNLLAKIEIFLFITTIITLLAEAVLIFRPISYKLKKNIESLKKSKEHQKTLSNKLEKVNKYLSNSLVDLREVYQSLEKFTIMTRMDSSGVITYSNDNFAKILGYSPNDIIGRRLNEFVMEETSYSFNSKLTSNLQNNTDWSSEVFLKNIDGRQVYLDFQLFQLKPTQKDLGQGFIAFFQNISERMQRQKDLEIEKTRLIIQAQEKERKRLSQELHDGVGQMLTGIKLNSESLLATNTNDDIKESIKSLNKMILETIQESRRVASNLAPPILTDFGLNKAIENLCIRVDQKNGLNADLVLHQELPRFNPQTEITLYRIVQEAINNVQKHANAENLTVTIDKEEINVHFYIEDDGDGMDLRKNKLVEGHGLLNIRERVELYKGRFLLKSNVNKGTLIHIVLPIKQLEKK